MVSFEDIWSQSGFFQEVIIQQKSEASYYLCKCGGQKVFPVNDLPSCSLCGMMDTEYISEEAEWMTGADCEGPDPSRCGGPIDSTLFSTSWGMGTKITAQYGNSADKKMSRIHFHMSMNHRDRSLFHAYTELEKVAKEKLGCSNVIIDDAKMRYKEFSEKKLTRGDVRKGIKANCLFLSCKKFGYPRTTREIAEAFGIDTRDVGRTSNILSDAVQESEKKKITMPKDVVVRIFENMTDSVDDKSKKIRQCVNICQKIERSSKLMGKTPSGVASAVIYVVLKNTISKQSICSSANISIPTLNKIETTIRELVTDLI